LPWRDAAPGARDPYPVWVSEIMLQQTRVEVVIPYFEAWMEQFPSVEALAAASEDQVTQRWAGLGYYRRARMLHAAAQQLVALGARGRGGQFWPTSAEAWLAIGGVGAYTSAALASLAGDEDAPVVDGNVKRVVARYTRLKLAANDRALHQAAEAWMAAAMASARSAQLDSYHPGLWNEAVMEWGATICTPRAPKCEQCPLASACASRGHEPEKLPLPAPRKKWVELELVYGLAASEQGVALLRRESGWNPGLWEPPSITLESPDIDPHSLWPSEWGVLAESLGEVRHTITRHKIRARVHRLEPAPGLVFIDASEVGVTGLAKKILARWLS